MNSNFKKLGLLLLVGASTLTACKKGNRPTMTVEEEKQKIEETKNKKLTDEELASQKRLAYEKAKVYAEEQRLSEGKIYKLLTSTDIDNLSPKAANYGLAKLKDIDWVENAKYQIEQIKKETPDITDEELLKILTDENGQFFTESEVREALGELEPLEKSDDDNKTEEKSEDKTVPGDESNSDENENGEEANEEDEPNEELNEDNNEIVEENNNEDEQTEETESEDDGE